MSGRTTAGELLSRVRVVLCRPRNPQNLGAAARALRCGGLSRWTLVDPQCDPADPEATRVAVHAEGLLQLAAVAPDLKTALAGCAVSIGASARVRFERPPLPPTEACEQLLDTAERLARRPAKAPEPADRVAPRVRRPGGSLLGGEVALVFGDERAGLTTEESEICDLLTSIPSSPEQPSWNLAQAIAIYSFTLRQAALARESLRAREEGEAPAATGGRAHGKQRPPWREEKRAADAGQMAHIDGLLAQLLEHPLLHRQRLRRRLFVTLERARLSERESTLWSALLQRVKRLLDGERGF